MAAEPPHRQHLTPPQAAVQAALNGMILAEGPGAKVSAAGLEVANALLGRAPLEDKHLAAMAHHPWPTDQPIGWMFGGDTGRDWAQEILTIGGHHDPAPVTAAVPGRPDLRKMSGRLNTINRQFRDGVAQVLGQAMRQAMRRADIKVQVRAKKKTASALAPVLGDFAARRYGPAVLAAVGATPDELLHNSFQDAADQVGLLFDRRQLQARRLMVSTFKTPTAGTPDIDDAYLDDQWGPAETTRRDAVTALVLTGMFALASLRLSQGLDPVTPTGPGEVPVDPEVPTFLVRDITRVATGNPARNPDSAALAPVQQQSVPVAPPALDYTDQLVSDLVQMMVPGAGVVYTWTVGDPAVPFDPHQALAGFTATNESYFVVFAKDPDEFPYGNEFWLPGDHGGDQCDLDIEYVETSEEATSIAAAATIETATYTIDGDTPDGAMVCLVPDMPELLTVPDRDPAAALHITLKYLGHAADWADQDRTAINEMVDAIASTCTPFRATITDIGPLGDQGAVVAFLDVPGLPEMRDRLSMSIDILGQLCGQPTGDTYPTFRPHLSIGYNLDPDLPEAQTLVGLEFQCSTLRMAWGPDLRNHQLEPTPAP